MSELCPIHRTPMELDHSWDVPVWVCQQCQAEQWRRQERDEE